MSGTVPRISCHVPEYMSNPRLDSLLHCPALVIACVNGFVRTSVACNGGIIATTIEIHALHIGTVMN